jgi:hypothetical protein
MTEVTVPRISLSDFCVNRADGSAFLPRAAKKNRSKKSGVSSNRKLLLPAIVCLLITPQKIKARI